MVLWLSKFLGVYLLSFLTFTILSHGSFRGPAMSAASNERDVQPQQGTAMIFQGLNIWASEHVSVQKIHHNKTSHKNHHVNSCKTNEQSSKLVVCCIPEMKSFPVIFRDYFISHDIHPGTWINKAFKVHVKKVAQMSGDQNPGWLFDIGDDNPTQLYRDYNKPL